LVNGYRAAIQGQVQGLGFRPYVYRLAGALGLKGFVRNSVRGVEVLVQGRLAGRFLKELRQAPPPLAAITSFHITRVRTRQYRGFSIRPSGAERGGGVDVLPDLAVCRDCRREIANPRDHRYGYAFTNCTQCGPRYTIIERLPYDRPNTTMAGFRMCPLCRREYADPEDRRHHAQPVACPHCGPELSLLPANSQLSPLDAVTQALLDGRVVAIKSLGGFQLACDATNDRSVRRLRRRKHRPAKPFALMCESVAAARRFCRVSAAAEAALRSAAAPIVLLPKSLRPTLRVSASVAPDNPYFGVMLPYTPLHALLFDRLRDATGAPAVLVMTSANRKEDPIAADDKNLSASLAGVYDLVLTHNRPIANRCDDSVAMVGSPEPLVLVRRARGYAPQPLRLGRVFHVKHPVLAVGGELKNVFALARHNSAYLSPHIGTVATDAGEKFWLETLDRYTAWTGIRPQVIATDLHPDYASTRLAERLSRALRVPLVRVQHHCAHILSVMAEHDLRGPVLGIAFDGTGYGTDGAIWGGEFLLVDDNANWWRVGHLGYLTLTSAGEEVANPDRVRREYLAQQGDTVALLPQGLPGPGPRRIGGRRACPANLLTSSAGRLFDAVAAMTGACRSASFDGQAPIALEAQADRSERGNWYTDELLDLSVSPAQLRPRPLLARVAGETARGTAPAKVAARFHNTLSLATLELANVLCARYRVSAVCLSGGSFQNSLLRDSLAHGLRSRGRNVFTNRTVPPNDGGIAYGQVAACACAQRPLRHD
jgi:hydrogenase maturation protein HypF